MLYDINAKLSNQYRLKDLTITTAKLTQPNEPTTLAQWDNLVLLAKTLEELERELGPFRVISAFRTKELQRSLSSAGEPTSTGTSFHEVGRAVDIYPLTSTLDDFVGLLLAKKNLAAKFAEIAYKPGQKSVHLSINVPGDTRPTKVLYLNEAGKYGALSLAEIQRLSSKYLEEAKVLVGQNKVPVALTLLAIAGATTLLMMRSQKA